ncbi:MAG: tetratricopeptide repeat protein [Bacteroidota bacterium]
MDKPKNALNCFKKAEAFLTNKEGIDYQIALSNIGAAYIQLNQAENALIFNTKAYELAIELEDKLGISICINNFATIYRDLNQSKKALEYYQKALSMVDELGSKEEKKTILFNLSQIHEKLGNSSLSLNYFKQYTNLKEELFNTEKNEFIVETQEKYDATERKKEIVELKLSEQEKDAQLMRMIYMIVICFIVLLFLGLILFFRIRWKNIQAKNQSKLELISATFEAEEKERQRISQDIHDELGGLLGVSRMLFTQTKKHLSDVNLELYNRVDELLVQANIRSRTISHELFSPTLKQFGLYPAIKEYLQNIQELHLDLNIEFEMTEIKLESQLELNIFRITQELITNTIKYAQAQKIAIDIEISPKELKYTYFDDGIGFDHKTIKKGVGLNSVSNRISRFQGKLDIKSSENKGLELNITIPL